MFFFKFDACVSGVNSSFFYLRSNDSNNSCSCPLGRTLYKDSAKFSKRFVFTHRSDLFSRLKNYGPKITDFPSSTRERLQNQPSSPRCLTASIASGIPGWPLSSTARRMRLKSSVQGWQGWATSFVNSFQLTWLSALFGGTFLRPLHPRDKIKEIARQCHLCAGPRGKKEVCMRTLWRAVRKLLPSCLRTCPFYVSPYPRQTRTVPLS